MENLKSLLPEEVKTSDQIFFFIYLKADEEKDGFWKAEILGDYDPSRYKEFFGFAVRTKEGLFGLNQKAGSVFGMKSPTLDQNENFAKTIRWNENQGRLPGDDMLNGLDGLDNLFDQLPEVQALIGWQGYVWGSERVDNCARMRELRSGLMLYSGKNNRSDRAVVAFYF